MKPKPSERTREGVTKLRASLQRLQQTVGLDDKESHTPSPVYPLADLDDPTVHDLAHNCSAALQLSGFASEKDERESLAR